MASFFAWYIASAVAGLLGLPWAFKLLRHLPDRGYSFARPLGLLLVGYAFWLLGSLGFLRNDVPGIVIAAAVVGAGGLVALRRPGLDAVRAWLGENWLTALGVEAVFVAAFGLMAYVRALNPAINGTEKPMEFMFINSVLRSPAFPPHDAWLAGHAISYYYFGYVLVGMLARATATASAVAFNLGLALLFGLAAVSALGVVLNLVTITRMPAGFGRGGPAGRDEWIHPATLRAGLAPAMLGPLLVLVVGNFYGLAQLMYQNGLGSEARLWAVRYYFGLEDPENIGATAPLPPDQPDPDPGVRAGWVNVWDWLDLKQTQEPLPQPATWRWDTGGNWFFAARVVHDRDLTGREWEAIDENPAFSFVLGDMHPHVLALPFVILAAGLALEWLLWGLEAGSWKLDAGSSVQRLASSFRDPQRLRTALVLGGQAVHNTGDFPIYLFLVLLALGLGLGLRWGWAELVRSLPRLALLAVVLAIASVLLYLPFYLTFQSQAGGLVPNLIWPTRFQQSLIFFGPTLVGALVYTLWLAYRGRAVFNRPAALWAAGASLVGLLFLSALLAVVALRLPGTGGVIDGFVAPLDRGRALSLAAQRRVVDSLASLFPALLLGLAAGTAVGSMRRPAPEPAGVPPLAALPGLHPLPSRRSPLGAAFESNPRESAQALGSPAVMMVLAMVATGALLMLGPEYLYLRDNFGLRMNTIFKFYFQTWTLWALAAAFGVWHLATAARRWVRVVGVALVALAVAGGLVYTFPALYATTGGFRNDLTLDGMQFFAAAYPDDWAAAQWLDANVIGAPVIAEAVGGAYQIEESRIAMASGLPTVMGWTNHEGQWRGDYYTHVAERPAQVQALYQVRDWAATQAVLDRYHIEYVIVGAQELRQYNPVYLPKFQQHMDVVFASGDLTIYRRRPAESP